MMIRILLTSWAVFFAALSPLAEAGVDRSHANRAVSPAISESGPRITADPGSRGPWRRESADGAHADAIEEETEDDERGEDGHDALLLIGVCGADRPAQLALSCWRPTLGDSPTSGRSRVLRC